MKTETLESISTHTAGPYHHIEVQRDGLIGYEVRAEDESVIAEIRPRPFLVRVKEENAQLLAAAPELLSALERCVEECYDEETGAVFRPSLEMVQQAIAAIAKAKGAK